MLMRIDASENRISHICDVVPAHCVAENNNYFYSPVRTIIIFIHLSVKFLIFCLQLALVALLTNLFLKKT